MMTSVKHVRRPSLLRSAAVVRGSTDTNLGVVPMTWQAATLIYCTGAAPGKIWAIAVALAVVGVGPFPAVPTAGSNGFILVRRVAEVAAMGSMEPDKAWGWALLAAREWLPRRKKPQPKWRVRRVKAHGSWKLTGNVL